MTEVVRIDITELAVRLEEVVFRASHGESFVLLKDDEPAALLTRHPDAPPNVGARPDPR